MKADPDKPLPYYRWYVSDHRASARVQDLNYLEEGLYRRLLDECWKVGYIPNDPVRLAKICRCPVGVIVRAWKQLGEMFITVHGLDGELLMSERLELERTQLDKSRIQRVLAGKASAAQRTARQRPLNARYIAVAEQSRAVVEVATDVQQPATEQDATRPPPKIGPLIQLDARLAGDAHCKQSVGRFLAELPATERPEAWARILAGYLDGLSMPGMRAAEPLDIAAGILAFERAETRSYKPAFLAAHIARCRESRLRPESVPRADWSSPAHPTAAEFWDTCKRGGLLTAPSYAAVLESVDALVAGGIVRDRRLFLAQFAHVHPADLAVARTSQWAIERVAERLATFTPPTGEAAA